MRGKAGSLSARAACHRITPAHAGKRLPVQAVRQKIRDHPRPCGEKERNHKAAIIGRGSPPPMRGKAYLRRSPDHILRITPAHAGKSNAWRRSYARMRDHPRPCGEKERGRSAGGKTGGSPPPMRGKGRNVVECAATCRITPAHAGKRP